KNQGCQPWPRQLTHQIWILPPDAFNANTPPAKPVLNPAMKAAFIAQHKEAYAQKIGACMLDAKEAQTMTLEFFSYGIRAGLTLSECIDLLATGNSPILLRPPFRLRPVQTSDLI